MVNSDVEAVRQVLEQHFSGPNPQDIRIEAIAAGSSLDEAAVLRVLTHDLRGHVELLDVDDGAVILGVTRLY